MKLFAQKRCLQALAGALLAPVLLLPVGALALHPPHAAAPASAKVTAAPAAIPQYTIKDLGAIYTTGSYEGYSYGSGLNPDGITIGYSNTRINYDGFRWDPLNGMLDLGNLALSTTGYENYNYSQAGQFLISRGLSADPAINDLGTNGIDSMVVGTATGYNTSLGYISRAFRFDTANGSLNLGTLGGNQSEAAAVNSAGNVAGYSYNAQSYPRAFLWQPTLDGTGHIVLNADGSYGTMTDLGTLQATPTYYGSSQAYGINQSGQIVGAAYTDSGYTHAFLYDTSMHDLGTLTTTGTGYGYSYAYGLNDAGQVFGTASLDSGYTHAFLYDGTMHDLGALDTRYPQSYATGISTDGKVCGYSYADDINATGDVQRAFIYDTAIHDLGALGAYSYGIYGSGTSQNSQAYAVNSSGQVVGFSYNPSFGQRAFVSVNGFMYELDTLLTGPGSTGWQLQYAYGINNSGQITGYGTNPDGYTHAYLLTPAAASATAPTPALSANYSLAPASAEVGKTSDPFTLAVNGTGFTPGSVVYFGATALTTHPQSEDLLYADVPASLVAAPGTVNVTVQNPNGSVTGAAIFTIYTPASVPTVTAVTPDRTLAGSGDTTVTVTGTGFDSDVKLEDNYYGEITPTSVSADGTTLTAVIPASALTAARQQTLYVRNPAPGRNAGYSDQYSNYLSFYVTGAAPAITGFSPDHATAASSDSFFLTVTGTGYNGSSRILVNGSDRTNQYYNPATPNTPYSFISPTQMQVEILPADIVAAGVVQITVTNTPVLPATDGKYPDGGSAEKDLPVVGADNPVPTVTELNQHSVPANQAVNLAVTGTGFVTGTTLKLLDSSSTLVDTLTPYAIASSTQLYVTVPAGDLSAPGVLTIEASNPSPGGGDSAPNPPHSTLNVGYAIPTVTAINPSTALIGSGAFTLTITGTGFAPGATVQFYYSGTVLTPKAADISADGTQIKVLVPASLIAQAFSDYVIVVNPPVGNAASSQSSPTSNAYLQAVGPVPTLTAVSPDAAVKNTDQTLTLTGTGFGTIYDTEVIFNGYGFTPATISADGTSLTVSIPGGYLPTSGPATVYVRNYPNDAAHQSASLPFTIQDAPNPVPTVTSLSSAAVTAGSLGFYLHVYGSGFVPGATINFNHVARTTQFNSAGDLQTRINTSELATGALYTVTVTNPVPGGGESTNTPAITFTVGNPVPTLSSLSAYSAPAGSGDLVLMLQGTGFVSTSQVKFGTRDTLSVDSASQTQQHLQITLPAADLAAPGDVSVTVFNPTPAGGTTSALTFTVTPPAPVITSLSPASATVGDGDTALTITGTGFYSGSSVTFNGTTLTPATPGSGGTTLTATIPAALLTAAGTDAVTVTNLGNQQASASFTVNNPVPAFTLSQNSAPVNSPDVALVLSGTGFVAGVSALDIQQGTADTRLALNVSSPTSATATLPAYLLTAAGSGTIRLYNPAPGGGSATRTFTVGTPHCTVTVSLSRNSANQVVAAVTLKNTGAIDVANAHVLSASLGGSAGTPTGLPLGLVPAGASKTTTVTFGSFTGAAGSLAVLKASLAYDGGSVGTTVRLPVP